MLITLTKQLRKHKINKTWFLDREVNSDMITKFLTFLGTNEIVLGICSSVAIVGFIITLLTWLKTKSISSILKYNSITSQYNKERVTYQKVFEGHRTSIVQDEIKTDKLLKDILKDVEAYDAKFREILTLWEQFSLWRFKRMLRKTATQVNFNSVSNYLAQLSGRLSKKEEIKNG